MFLELGAKNLTSVNMIKMHNAIED